MGFRDMFRDTPFTKAFWSRWLVAWVPSMAVFFILTSATDVPFLVALVACAVVALALTFVIRRAWPMPEVTS